jgi:hypothetical protein
MERNGMRREALHKKAFWARVDEEWVDMVEYAILAEEYNGATLNIKCPNAPVCTCPKTDCPNHSKCCSCVIKHREGGNLPFCLREISIINGNRSERC